MAVKTRESHFVIEGEHEFEIQFDALEGTEKVTIQGDRAVVSYLASDAEQGGWYFDENDQGTFINNDPRCRGERKSAEEIKELQEAHPDRFFVIHKYEHGLSRYYRANNEAVSATIPDQQWDVSHGAAFYIAPDDCPDPAKYCDSVMEEFTNWCNGDIYGVCHATYHRVPESNTWVMDADSDEECWGYIGREHAEQQQTEDHDGLVKRLA